MNLSRNLTNLGEEKIKLGVSACLLGEKVRYNGGHKLNHFLVDLLGHYVDYVPVCPEVEMGLPVPREAMRLVQHPGDESPRLVTQKTCIDHTSQMMNWVNNRLEQLEGEELCGYIFKSKSPSSGMERVKVYNQKGGVKLNGTGMFAGAFMKRFPLMPVEDDGRLNDIILRERFIIRIFTYHRWRKALKNSSTVGAVMDFHTKNKLLFMAHSPEIARKIGHMLGNSKDLPFDEFVKNYEQLMMSCVSMKSTVRKNANVLYHLMGYFKKQLEHDEKQELVEIIEQYRLGFYPLVVPVTLIQHYVRKYDQPYLKEQYYLNPHPVELKLRNHA